MPEAVAKDGNARRAGHIVGGRDGASEQRGNAQNLEKSRGDAHARNLHRLAVSRQIHGNSIDGRDFAEGAIARAPVEEILSLDHVGSAEWLPFPDHHQTVRLGEWQGAQQHRVHHAENRGSRTDAERQHGDRGHREAGRFA